MSSSFKTGRTPPADGLLPVPYAAASAELGAVQLWPGIYGGADDLVHSKSPEGSAFLAFLDKTAKRLPYSELVGLGDGKPLDASRSDDLVASTATSSSMPRPPRPTTSMGIRPLLLITSGTPELNFHAVARKILEEPLLGHRLDLLQTIFNICPRSMPRAEGCQRRPYIASCRRHL